MRHLLLVLLGTCAACSSAPQPASNETVAAFEVSLPTAQERAAFIEIVRDAAKAEGGHLDAANDGELRQTGRDMPPAKVTVHAAVWRGDEDDENWATIMDQADHLGQVWITFARGEDEALASRFRERAMRDIKARWPNPLSLPIIDHRTIPLRGDLIRTPTGYELKPSEASKYVTPAKKRWLTRTSAMSSIPVGRIWYQSIRTFAFAIEMICIDWLQPRAQPFPTKDHLSERP